MASFAFTTDARRGLLTVQGAWTLEAVAGLDEALRALVARAGEVDEVALDLSGAERLDTSGTYALVRTARAFEAAGVPARFEGASEDCRTLIRAVSRQTWERSAERKPDPLLDFLARRGEGARQLGREALDYVAFFGEVARAFARVVRTPSRLRGVSIVAHVHKSGLDAVPIVCLIAFIVGAIVAQQGAFQLRRFGAEVFVVNLVGILVLREVGLLLAAILFAGRSGSATTAEIGSMKMREEIDALRVMGLDPIEVLVLPRLLALVIALPLVTALANLAALAGGLVVCWVYLGIDPGVYIQTLRSAVTTTQLAVGFLKAPFMAIIIGIAACVEGLRVAGSTESLGRHTTAAVVKAIFMVIVMDGLFAILFAAIGW